MPDIQVLDPHVADLIAAGEVVERPASVAKELMENSMDAGASAVTVEIRHGGMTFLRVTDNGKGIPASQLTTAFLRHATSKLRNGHDLEAIGTLGFRGEALAAISAVSRVEMTSRTPEEELGASLSLEAGVPGPVEEAGCPLGTTLVVRDLFFNTPARLKFVKKDSAEGAAVFSVVQRIALSHPEVRVKFIRDGKQDLLTPGDGQLKSAVYAVLGRELALGLREVNASGEDMSVSGFVSLPACCRASRNWQFFFVNGRQVKSQLMMAALEEAYKNQRMVGKFPACVLHLNMKLNAVDVNVHPAKTQVKFAAERQVFSAVYHAVLSALENDRSHPQVQLNSTAPKPVPKPNGPAPAAAPERPVPPNAQNVPVRRTSVRVGSGWSQSLSRREPVPAAPTPPGPLPASAPPETERPVPTPPEPARPKPVPPAPPDPEPLIATESNWRVAGEVLNTYIVVEQGDTVYLIDKHAAHERMNFDRMKAEGYDPMAQSLLTPVTCRLTPQAQEMLLAQRTLLEEFGFEIDELGGALAVRQAPFDVAVEDIPATLEEIAQKLLTTGSANPSAARDDLLHTMACKAAVKGGWHTSLQELERVAQAVLSGQVKYCPHGRPVAIQLTKKDLEKQFRRA